MSRLSTSSRVAGRSRSCAAAARRSPGTSAASPTRGRAAGSRGRRRPWSRRAACRSASPSTRTGRAARGRSSAVVRKSRQVDLRARLHDARARVAAVGERLDERARAPALRVDRRDHLRRRARRRAGGVGAEADERCRCRSRVTVSGALATPGLTNSAVMSLPPSWPHARDVRTTACALCGRPRRCCPGWRVPFIVRLRPALVAVRLVRQRDQLGDVRELRRQRVEPRRRPRSGPCSGW